MTTYLLITSDKPTELKASTDGKNWLPVVNAEVLPECVRAITDKYDVLISGKVKLDTPVELPGWELDKVYQVMNPELDIYWENRSEVDYNGCKAIPGYFTSVAYRLIRSEPVKPNNSPFDLLDLSPIEAKTQESQTDLWNDLINLYDTTDRSSYGYASLVKALSEKFILTRRNH